MDHLPCLTPTPSWSGGSAGLDTFLAKENQFAKMAEERAKTRKHDERRVWGSRLSTLGNCTKALPVPCAPVRPAGPGGELGGSSRLHTNFYEESRGLQGKAKERVGTTCTPVVEREGKHLGTGNPLPWW